MGANVRRMYSNSAAKSENNIQKKLDKRKRFQRCMSLFVTLCMMVSFFVVPEFSTQAAAAGITGSGTSADPYLISTLADLQDMAAKVNSGDDTYKGKYWKLTADIDASSVEWTPIGNMDHLFTGTFDGNGHKISNVHNVNITSSYGFFGPVDDSNIKNVYLEDTYGKVTSTDENSLISISPLINSVADNVNISDVAVKISSKNFDCGTNGEIGGLVGGIGGENKLTIDRCAIFGDGSIIHNTSNGFGGTFVGSMMGKSGVNVKIKNSYQSVKITGTNVGTVFGYIENVSGYNGTGELTNFYVDSTKNASIRMVGRPGDFSSRISGTPTAKTTEEIQSPSFVSQLGAGWTYSQKLGVPVPSVLKNATDGANSPVKIGDYFTMGSYDGEPILWRCVDIDENGPLMMSDKSITLKAFDSYDDPEIIRASSYWGDSDIRSWLNSDASAGNVTWLDGTPPSPELTWNGYVAGAYDQEAGFLTNFTGNELSLVKEVEQRTNIIARAADDPIQPDGGSEGPIYDDEIGNLITNYDKAYYKNFTDKMFLPSVKQIDAVYGNKAILGSDYHRSRLTVKACNKAIEGGYTNFSDYGVTGRDCWYWNLRDQSNAGSNRIIAPDGKVWGNSAHGSNIGIRPAFYLNTAKMESSGVFAYGDGTLGNPYNATADKSTAVKIGDYYQMGTYKGEPILWRCVGIDENGPLMLSDKLIDVKMFDAPAKSGGSHNAETGWRIPNGSNYWGDSNIRSWLNSGAGAGNVTWLCGNPPKIENNNISSYDQEEGFLNSFTGEELDAINSVSQKNLIMKADLGMSSNTGGTGVHTYVEGTPGAALANYDNAYYEMNTDRMFLLNIPQLAMVQKNGDTLGADYYYRQEPTKYLLSRNVYYGAVNLRDADSGEDDILGSRVRQLDGSGNLAQYRDASTDSSIRPAFYMNVNKAADMQSYGAGTEESPYRASKYEIGDYIQMGTYNEKPIIWRVVDIDDNGPLVMSDKILTKKEFDAPSTVGSNANTSETDDRRAQWGSSLWADSDLRTWLNSDAATVDYKGSEPYYKDEAGFLSNFTRSEQELMKNTTQKTLIHSVDTDYKSGGTENHTYNSAIGQTIQNYNSSYYGIFTDKMFPLSILQNEAVYENSTILGENYWIGQAVEGLDATNLMAVWLRDAANADQTDRVRAIYNEDEKLDASNPDNVNVTNKYAAWDVRGSVRPAFYLDEDADIRMTGTGTTEDPYRTAAINVGTYINMGDYNGVPVTWRVVDIDENGPLLMTDEVISIKAFDSTDKDRTAPKGSSHLHDRSGSGSNYWLDSNIRSWLNSDAKAGNVVWKCGLPPISTCVRGYNNAYDQEAGFLNGFSKYEKAVIKPYCTKTAISKLDSSNPEAEYQLYDDNIATAVQNADTAESVTAKTDDADKVFLPDLKQINTVYKNSAILGDNYYIGKVSEGAAAKDESGENTAGAATYTWLRTPIATGDGQDRNARIITNKGVVSSQQVSYSSYGVRPMMYIDMAAAEAALTEGDGSKESPLAMPKSDLAVGDYVSMGQYNGERILWRVVDIDDKGPLLLADKDITIKGFDARNPEATGSHANAEERATNGSTYWGDSTIRQWLNSNAEAGKVTYEGGLPNSFSGGNNYDQEAGFLTNFSADEMKNIKKTTNRIYLNPVDADYKTGGSEGPNYVGDSYGFKVSNPDTAYYQDFEDTIFLPSAEHLHDSCMKNPALQSYIMTGYPTAQAAAKDETGRSKVDANTGFWSSSSLGTTEGTTFMPFLVSPGGLVTNTWAIDSSVGVRPMCYLTTTDLKDMFTGGSGSENNPYTIVDKTKINIGDYVKLGTYNGEDIIWRCVDIDENGPLMVTEQAITAKAYDVTGTTGSHARNEIRSSKDRGSNYWPDSNIRSWLNSDAAAGQVKWLDGNPPTVDKTYGKFGVGYANEEGFLNSSHFSDTDKQFIKTVTQKTIICDSDKEFADGGSENLVLDNTWNIPSNYDKAYYQNVTDKMFLMDVKQWVNAHDNIDILGESFFNATFTKAAIAEFWSKGGNDSTFPQNAQYTRGALEDGVSVPVVAEGGLNSNIVPVGRWGIRPAFYLNTTESTAFGGGIGSADSPYTVGKQLKVGDYVQMGNYNNTPILWRVVGRDEHGPLLVTDKAITEKEYDAAGTNTSGSHSRNTARQTSGSSYWGDSNIRDWLNSNADAGKVVWSCGNAPSYAAESGFLKNFTENELGVVKSVTQKTMLSPADDSVKTPGSSSTNFKYYPAPNALMQNYNSARYALFTDKMFVMDLKQADMLIKNLGTDYFVTYMVGSGEYRNGMIRTPYMESDNNVALRRTGVQGNSDWASNSSDKLGVRPAFYLDESKVAIADGADYSNPESPLVIDSSIRTAPKFTGMQSITKKVTDKTFDMGQATESGAALTYQSSNENVVTVDENGQATIKGAGVATVTVNAAPTATSTYGRRTVDVKIYDPNETGIEVGQYIVAGEYNGVPIVWRCVDVDENGPLMMSDELLTIKALDAYSSQYTGSHARRSKTESSTSNYWGDSTLRSWLQSDAPAGEVVWQCGNPPVAGTLDDKTTPYNQEAGFMTNFNDTDKALIKTGVVQKSTASIHDFELVTEGVTGHDGNDSYFSNNVAPLFDKDVYEESYTTKSEESVFIPSIGQFYNVYANEDILGSNYYSGKLASAAADKNEFTGVEGIVSPTAGDYWISWSRDAIYSNGFQLSCIFAGDTWENSDVYGFVGSMSTPGMGGVRPAFYLNTDNKASFVMGDGSKEMPFKTGITVGDYFTIGMYNDEPIVWRCVDVDENGPLVMADKVIASKSFDAAGTATSGSHSRDTVEGERGTNGSNYWGDSNIRQWLNSAEAQITDWSCGNSPVDYADEAGFKRNFSAKETQAIALKPQKFLLTATDYSAVSGAAGDAAHEYKETIDTAYANYDTAYGVNTSDAVFLPSVSQLTQIYKNHYSLGDDYYKSESAYWLRDPNTASVCQVRVVNPDGTVTSGNANDTTVGIRPMMYLASTDVIIGKGSAEDPYLFDKKQANIRQKDGNYEFTEEWSDEAIDLGIISNTDSKLIYTSKDPSVASVDENGVVTMHSLGSTTISVTSAETDYYKPGNMQTLTFTVTKGLPSVPKNVTMVPGNGQTMHVSWDASDGRGSDITGYMLYVLGTVNGEEILNDETLEPIELGADELTYDIDVSDRIIGDEVTAYVIAVSEAGESAQSEIVSQKIGSPTAPKLVKASADTTGASMAWEESQQNGIARHHYTLYISYIDETGVENVTSFNTEKAGASDCEMILTKPVEGSEDTDRTYNFVDGMTYSVWVTCTNAAQGESVKSNVMKFTFAAPQKPASVDTTAGDGTLTVHWTEPENNGGSEVIGYNIYLNDDTEPTAYVDWTTVNVDEATTKYQVRMNDLRDKAEAFNVGDPQDNTQEFTVVITGLANGVEYNARVTARNANGFGPDSSTDTPSVPITKSTAPKNITAIGISGSEVKLTWTRPIDDGGSDITGYRIQAFKVSEKNLETGEYTALEEPVSAGVVTTEDSKTSYVMNGLDPGFEYSFEIAAQTAASELGDIGTSENTAKTYSKPSKPVIKLLESGVGTSDVLPLTVKWDAPADNGGSDIIGYDIMASRGSAKFKMNIDAIIPAGTTEYVIRDNRLQNENSYDIYVVAYNGVTGYSNDNQQNGSWSDVRNIEMGTLPAPDGIVVTGSGDGTMNVSWSLDKYVGIEDNILRFNIYLNGEREASTGRNQDTGKLNNSKTMTLLAPNEEFKVEISAVGADGAEGAKSYPVFITLGAPKKVMGVTATAATEGAHLTWTESDAANGSVTEYLIYKNNTYLQSVDATAADFTPEVDITGLEGGVEYTFTVAAKNANGEGEQSDAVKVRPWAKPDSPTVYDIVSGIGGFTFKFDEVDGHGGEITDYKIYVDNSIEPCTSSTTPSAVISDTETEGTKLVTVSGVSDDKSHTFYVVAVNDKGETSIIDNYYTVKTGVPSAVKNVKAIPGVGNATITFDRLPDMGEGYEIQSYQILSINGTNETVVETVAITDVNKDMENFAVTINNLTDGTPYQFAVRATNINGVGEKSGKVSVTPGTPGAPVIIRVTPKSKTLTVEWSEPQKNAGKISLYTVYLNGEKAKTTYDTSVVINDLENGKAYDVTVTATNYVGESSKSAPVTSIPGDAPGTVDNIIATATYNSTDGFGVHLSWSGPEDNGGMPVDEFIIRGNGFDIPEGDVTVNFADKTADIIGLETDTDYQFDIIAKSTAGEGTPATSDVITTLSVPDEPTLEGVDSANRSIMPSWTAPEHTGGTDIVSYTITATEKNGTKTMSWIAKNEPEEGELRIYTNEYGELTVTIPESSGVVVGQKYNITVKATNAVGDGEESSVISVTVNDDMKQTMPSEPTNVIATAKDKSVVLTWEAPVSDGNSTITEYVVYSGTESDNLTRLASVDGHTFTYTHTGLTNGTTYYYKVKAVNGVSSDGGPLSDLMTATPIKINGPSKPEWPDFDNNENGDSTAVSAYETDATGNTMTITWKPSTGEEIGGDISYQVWIDTELAATITDKTTSYKLTNLESNHRYNIQIKAVNAEGVETAGDFIYAYSNLNIRKGSESEGFTYDEQYAKGEYASIDSDYNGEEDSKPTYSTPSAPTNAKIEKVAKTATVKWDAPVTNGNKPIIGYKVYVNGTLNTTVPASSKAAIMTLADGEEASTSQYESTFTAEYGQPYSVAVRAYNSIGDGESASLYVSPVVDPPTNLKAEVDGTVKTQVNLTWTAPVGATDYKLTVNGAPTDIIAENLTITDGTATYNYPGEIGKDYYFTVLAVYDSVESTPATCDVVSTKEPEAEAPQGLAAVGDKGNVTLSWRAPSNAEDEGVDIAKYIIFINGEEHEDKTVLAESVNGDGSYSTILELQDSAAIKVCAESAYGTRGKLASTSYSVKDDTDFEDNTPPAPINVTSQIKITDGILDDIDENVIISWQAGATDEMHTVPSEKYNIIISTAGEADITAEGVTETTYGFKAKAGTLYSISIEPVASEADGSTVGPKLKTTVEVPKNEYAPPITPVLTCTLSEDKTKVTLTWTPETQDSTVHYMLLDGGEEGIEITSPYEYTITDPTKTNYNFAVKAIKTYTDIEGAPTTSATSNVVTVNTSSEANYQSNKPVITSYKSNIDATKVKVFWNAPETKLDGETGEIEKYEVVVDGEAMTPTVAADATSFVYEIDFALTTAKTVEIRAYKTLPDGSDYLSATSDAWKISPVCNTVKSDTDYDDDDPKTDVDNADPTGNGKPDTGDNSIKIPVSVNVDGAKLELLDDVNYSKVVDLQSGAEEGKFEGVISADDISSDRTYTITIKKDGHTRYTITDIPASEFTSENISNIESKFNNVELTMGDLNGDNMITFLDQRFVTNNIGKSGDNITIMDGDMNGDHIITFLDQRAVTNNIGKSGSTKSWNE